MEKIFNVVGCRSSNLLSLNTIFFWGSKIVNLYNANNRRVLLSGSKRALAYAAAWNLVLIEDQVLGSAIVENTLLRFDHRQLNVTLQVTSNRGYSHDAAMDPEDKDTNFPNSIDTTSYR